MTFRHQLKNIHQNFENKLSGGAIATVFNRLVHAREIHGLNEEKSIKKRIY